MTQMSKYLLQIIATAIVCSIACAVGAKGKFSTSLRMLSGVILLISIVKSAMPVLQLDSFHLDMHAITQQADEITARGSAAADAFEEKIISENISAYIEEKVGMFDADICVDTTVLGGVPVAITISGHAIPYTRSQIISWIETELGIEREAVNWP